VKVGIPEKVVTDYFKKGDSFRFAPQEKRKTKSAVVLGEISNRKHRPVFAHVHGIGIMSLPLQTQKADNLKFAPYPDQNHPIGSFFGYVRSSEVINLKQMPARKD
jgi:hypothetical protein